MNNNHSQVPPEKKLPLSRKMRGGGGFALLIMSLVVLIGLGWAGKLLWANWQEKQTRVPGPQTDANSQTTPTADPVNLNIPSLNISAPFIHLGLNADHTLEVPKTATDVGWFIHGAKPGDIGPAVVVGHLDSPKGPAVFANLKNIKAGDLITINRVDSTSVQYKVDSISKFSQDNFPTEAVYGTINYAGLRLITCAGTYNKAQGHYSDNLVVFATLVK
jgi:LPXTG-site transpeptidase (sortase) family protein